MLDPLIYGSVEFDEPPLTMTPPKTQQHIASLPHTTMPRAVPPLSSLPKTETDRIPSYVHPNLRELTADDIKDVQEHTTLLKTASAKKAEDAKQRRRAPECFNASSPKVHEGVDLLKSNTLVESLSNSKRAREGTAQLHRGQWFSSTTEASILADSWRAHGLACQVLSCPD